jgi:hypothetical protein
MAVASLLIAVLGVHVLGILTPDDSRVINTFLNTVSVLGLAVVGYLQAKLLHENRQGRENQNRR